MKRRSLIIGASLFLLLGAAGAGFYWLCYTESGLRWLAGRASHLKTVQLHIDGLQGRLSGPIRIERLEIVHERARIVASGVRVQLRLRDLTIQTVYADELHADSADIILKSRAKSRPKRKPRFLPLPWLTIRSDAIEVARTHLTLQNGQEFETKSITGKARLTSRRLRLRDMRVAGLTPDSKETKEVLGPGAAGLADEVRSQGNRKPVQMVVSGSSEILASDPIGVRGDLQWSARLEGQPQYSGRVQLTGDLAKLDFAGNLLQPHAATLSGTAFDLTERWHWTTQVSAPAFDLKPWSPQSGLGTFVVTLTAKGDRESLQANGRIEPQALPTGPMELSLKGAYAKRRLRTDRLELRFGVMPAKASAQSKKIDSRRRGNNVKAQAALSGTLAMSGEVLFAGGFPDLKLHGQWAQLDFPGSAPVASSRQGNLTLEGQLPYAFTASGDLAGVRVPSSTFSSRGSIDRDRLTLDAFAARFSASHGVLSASGELVWGQQKAWQFRLDAQQLNPAEFHKAFPGNVGFSLAGSGHGFELTGPWQLKLDGLRGQLRAQPLSGHAQVSRNADVWQIGDTRLQFGNARLEASGSYDKQPNLRWLFSAEDLSRLLPEAGGRLYSRGQLSGSSEQPQLTASLQGSGLQYQQYHVGAIEADADIDLRETSGAVFDRGDLQLQIKATELGLETRRIRSLRVSLDGSTANHQLQTHVDAGNVQLDLAAQGAYEFPQVQAQSRQTQTGSSKNRAAQKRTRQWQGTLSQLKLTAGEVRLALEAPTPLTLGPEHIEVNAFCLLGNSPGALKTSAPGTPPATPSSARACGNAHWQAGAPWAAQLKAQALPLRLLAAGLPREAEYSGALAIDAQATGQPASPWTGAVKLDVSQGQLHYRRSNGRTESISIGSGRAEFNAEPKRFMASVKLDANEAAELTGRLTAQRLAGAGWRQLPLSGSVQARTRELGFVPVLVPEIDRASGELSASFDLAGTLGAPQFNGTLGLDKGEMDLFTVNLLLRDLGLRLDFNGNSLKLEAHARAGEGSAEVQGQLAWKSGTPKGSLRLKGENLLIANVPEARVQSSPDITVNIDGRDIQVDGAVRVPYARLAPANLSGAVLPSADEVIAGSPPADPEKSFRVTTGVHLILGNDVRIDSYGLSGRLTGSIALYMAPNELSTGAGELRIVENREGVEGQESKYVAYGRELDIERGRLIFTGGALSDPGVDIRASRKIGDVTAGVNVRGSLRNPRLSFFSDPPLPQTQIASLLVSGRAVFDPLQSGAAQGGSQTREQLLAQGGALVARQLGSQLGIDDVTVESNLNESTSLVLGKYLSPRLYVGYGISLAETINTLKLRYTLGDRWTLKMEAGAIRSADVVYSIDR